MTRVENLLREAREMEQSGRIGGAVQALEEAARLAPGNSDICIRLGALNVALGRWRESIDSFAEALRLRPDLVALKVDIGSALCAAGRVAEAESQYNEVLEADPFNAAAHGNLTHILYVQQRYEEAEAHARIAADVEPYSARARHVHSVALYALGRLAEAEQVGLSAIALEPNLRQAHLNLYNIRRAGKRYAEAEDPARRAVQIMPNDPSALEAVGQVLFDLGRYDEAVTHMERVVRIFPASEVVLRGLAQAYRCAGSFEDAVASSGRAVEVEATADSIYRLSLDQIRTGRLHEGWRNYENRDAATKRTELFGLPKWDGAALTGRTLLVYAEGGLGDTIQYARYLPHVVERTRGTVIFECPIGLIDLLDCIPGVAKVIPQPKECLLPADPVDCHVSLMSLPYIFDTTEETIPSGLLSMRVSDVDATTWRERLSRLPGLKIGLRWAGNPDYPDDATRSMSLDRFAPLASIEGVTFVSLQIGSSADEICSGRHGLSILHAPEDLTPMSRTAALLRELDLVISTCTSIPHLAGALGVETWLLLPFVPHWIWNVNHPDDTPWYPRHRLFRQPRFGDWESVIRRVADELSTRIAEQGGATDER